jgi:hypothetical protein
VYTCDKSGLGRAMGPRKEALDNGKSGPLNTRP